MVSGTIPMKKKGRGDPGLESGGAILQHRAPFGPFWGNLHEMDIARAGSAGNIPVECSGSGTLDGK